MTIQSSLFILSGLAKPSLQFKLHSRKYSKNLKVTTYFLRSPHISFNNNSYFNIYISITEKKSISGLNAINRKQFFLLVTNTFREIKKKNFICSNRIKIELLIVRYSWYRKCLTDILRNKNWSGRFFSICSSHDATDFIKRSIAPTPRIMKRSNQANSESC